MNWQLYMFFHLAGYDTRFFPKLFDKICRLAGTRLLV